MTLASKPPKGAGVVKHVTKTDQLLAVIEGLGENKNAQSEGAEPLLAKLPLD